MKAITWATTDASTQNVYDFNLDGQTDPTDQAVVEVFGKFVRLDGGRGVGFRAAGERFDLLVEAHNLLKDPAKRSQYDVLYHQIVGTPQSYAGDGNGSGGDDRIVMTHRLKEMMTSRHKLELIMTRLTHNS